MCHFLKSTKTLALTIKSVSAASTRRFSGSKKDFSLEFDHSVCPQCSFLCVKEFYINDCKCLKTRQDNADHIKKMID